MSHLPAIAELVAFTAAVSAFAEFLRRVAHHEHPLALHSHLHEERDFRAVAELPVPRRLTITAMTARESVAHRRAS
ncbi:MAG TPA: hypothetical protein VNF07_04660 [Acidimicrobiales bacterium]|nr:hypothetical protein [Acidimicrobiales bacterium]